MSENVENKEFAKMDVSALLVDYLMEHYGLFDLVELNQISLYVLKMIAMMEKEGFKIISCRKVNGKPEVYELDVHDLIAKYRIGVATAKTKTENTNKDEKNNL